VDEGRKRILLIVASILAARRLAQLDDRPSPAFESAIANAIVTAGEAHDADQFALSGKPVNASVESQLL